MLTHLRRHTVAYLALFLALAGTSFAAVKVGRNSVGSRALKKGAVTNAKLANNSVTAAKVKNGSLTSSDFRKGTVLKGPKGDRGNTGPAGPSTGAAGGDLTGTYPNPTLKPLGDWTALGGVCRFVPTVSWTTPAGFDSVAYRVDRDGVVHLRGAATCTQGINVSVVGALPDGLRPLHTIRVPIVETTSTTTDPNVYANIEPVNGELQIVNYVSTANSIFSFDGISFDTKH